MSPLDAIPVVTIDGETRTFGEFAGKLTLVVNVASNCGFTPQYRGLEALYRKFKDRGLVVLGFPCNQFAQQEPGSADDIKSFCSLNYDVTFPMFAKVDVNGARAHPLFKALKKDAPGILSSEVIKWNFTKFLVGDSGTVLKRYAPTDSPEAGGDDLDAMI